MKDEDMFRFLQTQSYFAQMRFGILTERYALLPISTNLEEMKIIAIIVMNGKASQKQIADFIASTPSNMSRKLEKMRKEGLIKREVEGDKHDRRKVLISITPKGKQLFKQALERVIPIRGLILSFFTKEELAQQRRFGEKLMRMADSIEPQIKKLFEKS